MGSGLKGDASFDELMSTYCPLVDIKRQLEHLNMKARGAGRTSNYLDDMIERLARSTEILGLVIDDIEGSNHEAFGHTEITSTVVLDFVKRMK